MRRVAVVGFAAAMACGGGTEEPISEVTPPAEARPLEERAERVVPEERPAPPLGRVAAPGAGPLMRPGQAVGPQTELITGQMPLALDLRDGGRVRFGAESRGRLGEEAPAQVMLGRGVLMASVPPQGNSERPPLRIGTPAGSVVLPGAGRCTIAVAASGATKVWAEAGRVELWRAGARRTLGPGEARPLVTDVSSTEAAEAAEPAPEDVPAAALAFASTGSSDGSEALEGEFEGVLTELDTALGELRSANAQVSSHDRAHREAVENNEPNALRLQRQAILQVAGRESSRRQALCAWERARAWASLLRQRPDPTTERRPALRQALGLDGDSEASEQQASEEPGLER